MRALAVSIEGVARRGRTGVYVLAAALGPGLLLGLRPSDLEQVVGGRARPVALPPEPGLASRGEYLMPTALVRRLTQLEVVLGRRGEHASAPGEMELAKADAWWAALDLVGVDQQVVTSAPGSPAADAGVRAGDLVVGDAGAVDAALVAGSAVTVRLLRDGVVLDVSLPAGAPAGWVLAAAPITPVAPSVETGHVAGASGGLVLALAEVDLLTPGDLTGGRTVAATGTIRPDGAVHGVLAYREKADAVADAGAQVLLVAAADADLVRALAPSTLTVIGVATLAEAVAVLCDGGGRSSACPPAPPI